VDPEIIGALIGPLLTAVLAVLAVGFKEWRRRRETADQRHETLQQAADEVAFIDAWLTAYAKIATEDQRRERAPRALADLERSYAAMTASHQAAATATQNRTAVDLLARILLLRLRRPAAKVLRVFYYIFGVLGFLFTLAGMSGNTFRGYPAWADYSYPGPLPNSPGQVGAGYPPPG
jgi:hypothetical protein